MASLPGVGSPVALQAGRCNDLFSRLVELSTPDGDVSTAEAADILGQFKVWSGNIGALHGYEIRSSLDFRLREAPKIASQVVELLEELEDSLNDGE
jgi:hypothetical protein